MLMQMYILENNFPFYLHLISFPFYLHLISFYFKSYSNLEKVNNYLRPLLLET